MPQHTDAVASITRSTSLGRNRIARRMCGECARRGWRIAASSPPLQQISSTARRAAALQYFLAAGYDRLSRLRRAALPMIGSRRDSITDALRQRIAGGL